MVGKIKPDAPAVWWALEEPVIETVGFFTRGCGLGGGGLFGVGVVWRSFWVNPPLHAPINLFLHSIYKVLRRRLHPIQDAGDL